MSTKTVTILREDREGEDYLLGLEHRVGFNLPNVTKRERTCPRSKESNGYRR